MNEFILKESNVPAHIDIEKDIQDKKDGQMTFTIRINDGNIVDYVPTEYVDARRKYIQTAIIKQLIITKQGI